MNKNPSLGREEHIIIKPVAVTVIKAVTVH